MKIVRMMMWLGCGEDHDVVRMVRMMMWRGCSEGVVGIMKCWER